MSQSPIREKLAVDGLEMTEVRLPHRTEWRVDFHGKPFGLISKDKPGPGEQTFFLCTTTVHSTHSHYETLRYAKKWMELQALDSLFK